MSNAPVIKAKVLLESQNTLGEGILWDSKAQLLHWVDIDEAEIHTLDPETRKYAVDSYPEEKYITALALRKDEPGFIGMTQHSVVLFPAPTPPAEVTTKPSRHQRKIIESLSSPLSGDETIKRGTRFNDGGCDPHGRMFAGSMTLPELKDGKQRGELWRIDPDGSETKMLSEIGTSNGIGWSPDGKTMYYIDSGTDQIATFAYDLSTGSLSDRKLFASPPLLPGADSVTKGSVFDGLTMDGVGNVWAARWKDSRVIGFNPKGEVICHITTPEGKSPTIPCFGGKSLETMYIATAHTKLAGDGDIQAQMPHSGDVFSVDFGPGSEVRKLLGEGWLGAERHRFGA